DPEEIAAVHHDVAVLQLLELDSESARIKRAGCICSLKVPGRIKGGDELTRSLAMEGLRPGRSLGQRFKELLGHETCVADHPHIGGKPAADIGAYRIDLDQRHLRQRCSEARREKIQACAKHQYAISLIRHMTRNGMRERANDAEAVKIAAEQILASCCGNEERTYLLGERLDRLASAGAVCPEPSHDEWAGGL